MSIVASAAVQAEDVNGPPGTYGGQGLRYQVRAGRPVVTTSKVFGAVSVPGYLGPRVRAWLTMLWLPGPILAVPEGNTTERWLFLSTPDKHLGRLPADVSDAGVWVCPAGTEITLPRTLGRAMDEGRRWVQPPSTNDELPGQSAVITAARRVLVERRRGAVQ